MDADRFEDLLRAWQDGDASAAELSELAAAVRADRSRGRALVEAALLEAGLYAFYGAQASGRAVADATSAPPARPRRRWAEIAAAGILLAVSIAGVAHLLGRPGEVREGRWVAARGAAPLALRFRGGAEATLEPGSAGQGRPDGFELAAGRGRFRVPGGASFRVTTPAGAVEASGAEFAVALRPLPGEERPELGVTVAAGTARVEAWGCREAVPPGRSEVFGPPSEAGARAAKLLEGAALPLAAFVGRAVERGGAARAARIEDDEGRAVCTVEVLRDGRLFEIEFDVRTGERLEEEEEGEAGRIPAARLGLGEAIERALAELPGRAIEASLGSEAGRGVAAVRVLYAGRLREIRVDTDTGRIVGR
jgi:uncharacterized membrane protein YkoI/ferric-dicitrate binding protein FerR (iron transport regulator)